MSTFVWNVRIESSQDLWNCIDLLIDNNEHLMAVWNVGIISQYLIANYLMQPEPGGNLELLMSSKSSIT